MKRVPRSIMLVIMYLQNLLYSLRSIFIKLPSVSKLIFVISSFVCVSAIAVIYRNNSKQPQLPTKNELQKNTLVSILVPYSGKKYSCYEDDKKSTAGVVSSLSGVISTYNDAYRFNKQLTDSQRQQVLMRMNTLEKDLDTFLSGVCPNFKKITPSTQMQPVEETFVPLPTTVQRLQERVMVVLPPNNQKYSCLKGTEQSIYKMRSLIDKSISENKIALDNMNKKIEDCNNKSLYPESILKCISDTTKIRDDFKKSSDANVTNMEIDFRTLLTEACI